MNHERKHDLLLRNIRLSFLVAVVLMAAAACAQDAVSVQARTSSEFLNTLSEQERAWLHDHPVIRVVQDPGWPPMEFANDQGAPSGMAEDYLRLLEQRLDMKFERVRNLSWQEAYARLKRWEIDMTTSVAVTPERAAFWAFTKPYMSIPIVIATHQDVTCIADMRELSGKKVAVVDGYAVNDWIPRDFPGIQLLRVKTAQEGLEALQRDEVFAYIDCLLVVGHYQAKMKVTNVKIAGETPYVNAQCMAVRKDWAPLAAILQKALDSLSETERNDIYMRWSPIRYEHGVNYKYLWQALAVFFVILLLLLVWNWKLSREIVERKRVEAALLESREQLFLALEVGNAGIWEWHQKSEKVCFDKRFHEMLGYTPGELPDMLEAWLLYHHPEEIPVWTSKAEAYLRGDIPIYESEHRIRTKAGTWNWVFTRGQFVSVNNEESRDKFIGIAMNITERKEAEVALRLAHERLRRFIDANIVGVMVASPSGGVIEANDYYLRTIGYSREEFEQGLVDWRTITPPEWLFADEIAIQELRERGICTPYEKEYVRRDGTRVSVFLSDTMLPGSEEQIAAFVLDITARKQAEAALRDNETKYRELVQNANSAIIRWSRDGAITFFNEYAQKFFGYSADEILGKHVDIIVPAKDSAGVNLSTLIDDIALNPENYVNHTNENICRDGRRVWMTWTNTPIFDGFGRVVEMLAVGTDITHRKQAEDALRESEIRHRAFFEQGPIGVVILNPNTGQFIQFNDQVCRQLGYTRDELSQLRVSDVESMELQEDTLVHMHTIMREGHDEFEARHRTKNGSIRYIHVTAQVIEASGIPVLYCIWHDVTEHKQAEEQLMLNLETQAAMNALLGLSLESRTINEFLDRSLNLVLSLKWFSVESKGAIFLADKAGETLHLRAHKGLSKEVSAACSTVPFGYCLCGRAATGRTVLFEERLDERHDTRYEGLVPHGHYCVPILSGEHVLGVINLCVKEGHIWSAREEDFLKAVANTLAGTIERRRAEAERERLMTAIGQAAEVVIITDPAGTIQYVNPAFERVTGYTRDEVMGKNPRILKSEAHDAAFYHALWKTISRGEIWEGRIVNKHKDGTLYTEEATISPVRDGSGRLVNYVAVKRDITHDLELEQQIRQSQKMEAIGQLAGGVAHDFNNILQTMMGNIEILLDNFKGDDEQRADLEEIDRGVERAAALTRQLLMFSRRQVMQPKMLDLNLIIEELLKMLRRVIGEDIRLEWVPGNPLGAVQADAGMMEQVLMNLCVNARDAMPHGGVLIIETQNVLTDAEYCQNHLEGVPGRFVLLSVTDTGEGMDEETIEHIFEPFFTTKGPGKGTGLGLATVYGIVRQHGGMVDLYSEPGKGTTFKVYFPLCAQEAEASSPRVDVDVDVTGGNETILLAEDDAKVRELAERILKHAGYTVLAAEDGEKAVTLFKENADAVALLLLDVIMPNLGGHEAFEIIRGIHPGLPTLFSSGYSEQAVHTNFVLHEGLQLIQKPYTPNALLRKVREVLDSAPAKTG